MPELICDERLDGLRLAEDIENMSDTEFEAFEAKVKQDGKYPEKYYVNRNETTKIRLEKYNELMVLKH